MEKLLTVSIASYNVEAFLRKTLDSCIVPELMDELEVLIVNDGSKDSTPEIAREYEAAYPETFRLIDKKNGGYGSTVNRSMQEARGTFYKLLDGDDWFDPEGLKSLMEALRTSTADYVISRIRYCEDGGGKETVNDPRWAHLEGQTVPVSAIDLEFTPGIWHTTVRTSILKEHAFRLPLHTLYTDQLFIVNTLIWARSVQFLSCPVYCYRIGRDGQSVSRESRIKHVDEEMKVVGRIVRLYAESEGITEENRPAVRSRVNLYYYYALVTLLLLPPSRETYRRYRSFEKRAKALAPDLYRSAGFYAKKVLAVRLGGWPAYRHFAGKVENFN